MKCHDIKQLIAISQNCDSEKRKQSRTKVRVRNIITELVYYYIYLKINKFESSFELVDLRPTQFNSTPRKSMFIYNKICLGKIFGR